MSADIGPDIGPDIRFDIGSGIRSDIGVNLRDVVRVDIGSDIGSNIGCNIGSVESDTLPELILDLISKFIFELRLEAMFCLSCRQIKLDAMIQITPLFFNSTSATIILLTDGYTLNDLCKVVDKYDK